MILVRGYPDPPLLLAAPGECVLLVGGSHPFPLQLAMRGRWERFLLVSFISIASVAVASGLSPLSRNPVAIGSPVGSYNASTLYLGIAPCLPAPYDACVLDPSSLLRTSLPPNVLSLC